MTQTLRNITYTLLAIASVIALTFALTSVVGAADAKSAVCDGVNIASGSTTSGCDPASGTQVDSLLKTIINIFSWVVGVVAVFVIIVGGLRFITANGDPANIAKARTIILYAIVGLVVAAVAQLLVQFVLGQV